MNFFDIFKKDNNYDEKTIIGFMAFVIIVTYAISDLIAGFTGKQLTITEFIFNGFLFTVLGTFGISAVQYFSKNNKQDNGTEGGKN